MRIWVQRYRLPLILLWQNRPFCPGISMKLGKFMIIYTIRKIRQAHPSFHQSYCWFCISSQLSQALLASVTEVSGER